MKSLAEVCALVALAFGGPVAIVGAAITIGYLRKPLRPLRIAHNVLVIVTLACAVAILVGFGASEILCWDCDGPLAWAKAFLPCSLFIWATAVYKRIPADLTPPSIAP